MPHISVISSIIEDIYEKRQCKRVRIIVSSSKIRKNVKSYPANVSVKLLLLRRFKKRFVFLYLFSKTFFDITFSLLFLNSSPVNKFTITHAPYLSMLILQKLKA